MTTNAIKYGSLSVPTGRLEICWALDGGNDHRRLHFKWTERGGPPVEPPTNSGFGSILLRQLVSQYLEGEVSMAWPVEGLEMSFLATLPKVAGDGIPMPPAAASGST